MVALSAGTLTVDGHTHKRTFAAHLGDVINVKGFGALGNGVNDDTLNIQAAIDWQTATGNRRTIYFPPGTYKVTSHLNLYDRTINMILTLCGEPGVSIITGNVNKYLIHRGNAADGGGGRVIIENLTIINSHATGGGIRIGDCAGCNIENVRVVANYGISTANEVPFSAGIPYGTFECNLINCHVEAYDSGGVEGLSLINDGLMANCTVRGYSKGILYWGGQTHGVFTGLRVEQCATGINFAQSPNGTNSSAAPTVLGAKFLDCGTAIGRPGTYAVYGGIDVEGNTGGITGNPQYGVRVLGDHFKFSSMLGLNIHGDFQVSALYITGTETNQGGQFWAGVGATNTVGGADTYRLSPTPHTGEMIACGELPIHAFSTLSARHLASADWDAGTVTLTTPAVHNTTPGTKLVSGITVGASLDNDYNGVFTCATPTSTTITYSLPSDPGAGVTTTGSVQVAAGLLEVSFISAISWAGGVVSVTTTKPHYINPGSTVTVRLVEVGNSILNGYNVVGMTYMSQYGVVATGETTFEYTAEDPGAADALSGVEQAQVTNPSNTPFNIREGDCYNVTDCNTAVQGASAAGGGANHVKVRWNGNDWKVIGK